MPRINQVAKLALLAVIVVVASASIIFMLKNKITDKSKQILEKRSVLALSKGSDENFIALKSNYAIVEKKLPILKNALPDEKNIEKAVTVLENLAMRTNNVQVLNFESLDSAKSSGENAKSLKFSVDLIGSAGSFTQYLNKLQNLPYFIEIDNLSMKNHLGIFSNESQMNIKAKIYIR